MDTRKKFKQCHPHDKLTQWIEPPPDRLLRLSLALSRWRRDCVATRPACDAILSAKISVRRVWTHAKEGKKKERKEEKKEKRRALRLKKIHRKDIRETQKTRRELSSIIRPEKAPRAFSSFCARPPPLLLPGPPPPSQRQATSSRAHRKFYYSILINGMTRAASYRQPDI